MTSTPNAEFLEIDPNQIGKAAAIDTALVAIDEAMGSILSVDASSHATPYTIPYATGDEPDVVKTALRFACLRVTGALSGDWTAYMPASRTKRFFVQNNTTGGHNVIIMVSGMTGVTLAAGKTQDMFLDGTDVIAVAAAL